MHVRFILILQYIATVLNVIIHDRYHISVLPSLCIFRHSFPHFTECPLAIFLTQFNRVNWSFLFTSWWSHWKWNLHCKKERTRFLKRGGKCSFTISFLIIMYMCFCTHEREEHFTLDMFLSPPRWTQNKSETGSMLEWMVRIWWRCCCYYLTTKII